MPKNSILTQALPLLRELEDALGRLPKRALQSIRSCTLLTTHMCVPTNARDLGLGE